MTHRAIAHLLEGHTTFRFDSKETRLKLISLYEEYTDRSFREVVCERVNAKLNKDELHLLPFILEKLWIGPELIYSDAVERELKVVMDRIFTLANE